MIDAKLPKELTELTHKYVEFSVEFIKAVNQVEKFFDFDTEKTYLWFRTKNMNFGNIAPLKLFQIGRGHKVLQFIEDAQEENSI